MGTSKKGNKRIQFAYTMVEITIGNIIISIFRDVNMLIKATVHIKIAMLTLLLLICGIGCKKTESLETKNVSMTLESWDCGAESWTVRCEVDTNGTLRVFGKGAMKDFDSFSPWSSIYNNHGIISVVIDDGVTTIGNGAFLACYHLKSVTIPNSVTSIGDHAFNSCYSLKLITIPNSVTFIGNYAFGLIDSLTSVTIPNSVTSIGNHAFDLYSASVTIPSSVMFIGLGAFNYSTSINVVANNPSYSSIDGVLFNENKTKLIQYPVNKKDTIYDIINGVTTIGMSAFRGSVSLVSVTIPNSVTFIEDWAFAFCVRLTSITIPDSVVSIGNRAFKFCWELVSVTSLNPVPPKIDALTFSDISMYACLYVPAGSRAAYRAADVWKDFKCIKAVK